MKSGEWRVESGEWREGAGQSPAPQRLCREEGTLSLCPQVFPCSSLWAPPPSAGQWCTEESSVDTYSSSNLSTAMNASVGSWTEPRERIFFLPSFCFSSSFFLRVMSPP